MREFPVVIFAVLLFFNFLLDFFRFLLFAGDRCWNLLRVCGDRLGLTDSDRIICCFPLIGGSERSSPSGWVN